MSAHAAAGDLTRWAMSAVVVVGLHALGAAALLAWHDPAGVGDESAPVVVDLAPYLVPSEPMQDLPTGPLQLQAAAPAAAPEEKLERDDEPKPDERVETKLAPQPQERIEVPPAPIPPVATLPLPEAVEPPPVKRPEAMAMPAPPPTAPPRERHASAVEINKWHTGIVARIESHLIYPEGAKARRQKGVVQVEFSFNREGRVVASKVAHASGSVALDQAALETLQKAQPFAQPPAGMAGEVFTFTIPVRFTLR
jgi:protein TonB